MGAVETKCQRKLYQRAKGHNRRTTYNHNQQTLEDGKKGWCLQNVFSSFGYNSETLLIFATSKNTELRINSGKALNQLPFQFNKRWTIK